MRIKINPVLFKYLFVGTMCFFADFFIFWFCIKILLINWFFATSISLLIVSLFSFYLYFNHVFGSTSKNKSFQLSFFIIANVVALIITQCILYIGIELIGLDAIFVKLFASGLVIVLNYIVRSKFIFI